MNEKIQDELEDDLREEYDLSQLKNPVGRKILPTVSGRS
jgi:hypothetical protein